MNTYGLDCAHHYSAPNLVGDAFLKICRAINQLLTKREHLGIVENMIRGGLASVYDERYFKANIKYMENYDSALKSTFGFMVDANNLYGGIMKTEHLPVDDFLLVEVSLEQVLNTPTDSPIVTDFPIAPTKEIVPGEWLSTYWRELKFNVNIPRSSLPTLLQTVTDKKRYRLHYRNLQLYVQLGLIVERVHRVLQFSQEDWMEPYIRLNTEKRQTARNKFEEILFKLMNNSAYGKTCESERRRMKLTLAQNADQVLQNVSRFTFKKFKNCGEVFAAITHDPKRIYWDKPTIVGATILELAKLQMYRFHNNIMKPHFDCRLLYLDTDSLLYKIRSEDLYKELAAKPNILSEFDFSNYPKEHQIFNNNNNKLVVLKYKDEFAGQLIDEFISLKPKLYSITSTGKTDLCSFITLVLLW